MRVGLACCAKRAQSEDRDEPVHGARSLDCKGHRAPVAHRIERSAPDRKAAGSIPARRTKFSQGKRTSGVSRALSEVLRRTACGWSRVVGATPATVSAHRRVLSSFQGTVGARRVESASSKARWVPDGSNPAIPSGFGRPGGPFPPWGPPGNPGEAQHPLPCPFLSFL